LEKNVLGHLVMKFEVSRIRTSKFTIT